VGLKKETFIICSFYETVVSFALQFNTEKSMKEELN
jgi:hypothetical protein